MRGGMSRLAAVEARRLLTHPILLMGAALSASRSRSASSAKGSCRASC